MHMVADPWADLDNAVLGVLAGSQQRDCREVQRALPGIDARHIRVSLALHVQAGRLMEIRDAVNTSYRITGAGLAHLQQTTTLAKAA